MIEIVHVITSLEVGGAQMVLLRLLAGMDDRRFRSRVVTLASGGPLGARFVALGVPVTELGMRPGAPDPRAMVRLARMLRRARPDVVQTWMYHADLVGGVAARVAGVRNVVWGVRHTDLPREATKRSTRWVAGVNARTAARVPRAIVCCSRSAREVHVARGYPPTRTVVVPNGYEVVDVDRPAARRRLRAELALGEDAAVVGRVARFHPQKDHRSLVAAAALARDDGVDAHYVLCGEGVTPGNPDLAAWVAAAGLADRFHLLGGRDDVPAILAGLDLAVSSSSSGEAHPGAVAEAMAAGTPVVATDVGDSKEIVGDTGRVVGPRDPAALAAAMGELLRLDVADREALGGRARARIEQHFALPTMVGRYEDLYERLARGT